MKSTIGILGGGAAGMAAAITAARNGAAVTILEGNDRLGKKILSTGNGKCNLGNLNMNGDWYYTDTPEFLKHSLERFGTNETIEFFRSMGLMITGEKNGCLYPVSRQASTVLDALRYEVKELEIKVETQCHVDRIERETSGKIRVTAGQKKYIFDKVVLACGGKAAPKTGSDGSGYKLVQQLGHSLKPVVPALVQLKCREDWFKSVSGVRAEAAIYVMRSGKPVVSERGEVQLTDYGISGIPVFQISRVVNYILREEKEVEVVLDLMPDFVKEDFAAKMEACRPSVRGSRTVEEYFTGLLNKKLMLLFIKLAGLKSTEAVCDADSKKISRVYELCRKLTVHVTGSNAFDSAQVCAGGVPLKEITENMESQKVPGVYLAGEILDVDGKCGGYNLQWAWCSGCIAGAAAAGADEKMF